MDGRKIEEFNIKWLRSQISIVSQEPVLFASTIRDNILYGVDNTEGEFTQEKVEDVCKQSNIHNFIMTLPHVSD